eukprot:sb/3469615/
MHSLLIDPVRSALFLLCIPYNSSFLCYATSLREAATRPHVAAPGRMPGAKRRVLYETKLSCFFPSKLFLVLFKLFLFYFIKKIVAGTEGRTRQGIPWLRSHPYYFTGALARWGNFITKVTISRDCLITHISLQGIQEMHSLHIDPVRSALFLLCIPYNASFLCHTLTVHRATTTRPHVAAPGRRPGAKRGVLYETNLSCFFRAIRKSLKCHLHQELAQFSKYMPV